MNFQTGSDSPNWDLTKLQIPIFPQLFGWISRPGPIPPIRIWYLLKLGFEQVPNPNFSPTVWMNFQTGSNSPNWDLSKVQIPIFSRPFEWISRPVSIPPIKIWARSKSQFFLDRLDEFLDRVQFPQLKFEQVPNPNFSLTILMNFQTRSDSPNWDLSKFQIPSFP